MKIGIGCSCRHTNCELMKRLVIAPLEGMPFAAGHVFSIDSERHRLAVLIGDVVRPTADVDGSYASSSCAHESRRRAQ